VRREVEAVLQREDRQPFVGRALRANRHDAHVQRLGHRLTRRQLDDPHHAGVERQPFHAWSGAGQRDLPPLRDLATHEAPQVVDELLRRVDEVAEVLVDAGEQHLRQRAVRELVVVRTNVFSGLHLNAP
jgi:hypothetical protein